MINHDYSVLYNYTDPSPSGIPSFISKTLLYPPGIARAMGQLRGGTIESADEFAIHSLKLIDASTYQSALYRFDGRLTFQINQIVLSAENSAPFVERVLSIPPDAIVEILEDRPDLKTTYRDAEIQLERAAALLVGLIEKITVFNNA